MSISKGEKVNIIAGPREPASCAFACGRLILLPRPKETMYVAYVEGHTGWWESSTGNATFAVERLQHRLDLDGIEYNEPVYTLKPIVL